MDVTPGHEQRGSITDDSTGSPYAPRDACGVGFSARQSGTRTHEVVTLALEALSRTAHRGATDGLLLAAGQEGDRVGVRHSGACAVVEGV